MINKTLNKLALYLGIFMMFGIIVIPNFRNLIGNFVGIFLNPLLSILPIYVVIFILASITGLYASLIQKYTMDWELTRRLQKKMKTIQEEFKKAQISNNPQAMKKLEAQRAAMVSEQMQMMKQQFKPMLYISIISIPLFYWMFMVIKQYPDATMIFPFMGEKSLKSTAFGPFQYWLFWYFLCSIITSQITRKSLNIGGIN